MKKWIGIVLAGLAVIAVLIFIITSLWIGSDVRRYCKTSKKIYGGTCVSSLSEMVDDAGTPYRDRNHAVWALGQLGDPKALTYLNKYYTGNISGKENLDSQLSQYELSKAMKLMQGELNLSAIVWRHNIK